MIEIEFYAPGVREESKLVRLTQELDTRPALKFKVDANHDIVYFEFEDPDLATYSDLRRLFRASGLVPRLVGEKPDGLKDGTDTEKLHSATQRLK